MTHAATAVHALRLPLLVATTLALALPLAVGIASPAAGLVDDSVAQQSTGNTGFEPTGEGFIDSGTPADQPRGHDRGHQEAAPVGGVRAGFGGMAGDEGGPGAHHAVAAALLGLLVLGLAAHRRRVGVGSI